MKDVLTRWGTTHLKDFFCKWFSYKSYSNCHSNNFNNEREENIREQLDKGWFPHASPLIAFLGHKCKDSKTYSKAGPRSQNKSSLCFISHTEPDSSWQQNVNLKVISHPYLITQKHNNNTDCKEWISVSRRLGWFKALHILPKAIQSYLQFLFTSESKLTVHSIGQNKLTEGPTSICPFICLLYNLDRHSYLLGFSCVYA